MYIAEFDFKPKDHIEIAKLHDLLDFDRATKVTGAKFVFLKNEAVILELGLINYAIDKLRNKGFTPVITPDISRNVLVDGCGFFPRDVNASKIYTIQYKFYIEFIQSINYSKKI